MLWDLFCRVIDNWGDLGVCWRLAADLRARGDEVRLWVDDPQALAWMAPGATGVERWDAHTAWPTPGDVVVEAFGCELPEAFVQRMAARSCPPAWINLEYLSAEPYVLRSHGLRSPQQGAGQGLAKHFFYPGWVDGTGGLLREPGLARRQAEFDANAWLAAHGLSPRPQEQRVSLFCYRNPRLPGLLAALARQARPTLLLATAGLASEQLRACEPVQGGHLRVAHLPPLSQTEYDHLLWSCDLNLVRGEDSFVRAQWAGKPFVWQIYPQDDGAHVAKLEAWHHLVAQTAALPACALALSRAWNGLNPDVSHATDAGPGVEPGAPAESHAGSGPGPGPGSTLPWPQAQDWRAWQAASQAWSTHLHGQIDLVTKLRAFVDSHRPVAQR